MKKRKSSKTKYHMDLIHKLSNEEYFHKYIREVQLDATTRFIPLFESILHFFEAMQLPHRLLEELKREMRADSDYAKKYIKAISEELKIINPKKSSS